jgi:glycosyltransferase involved in cell wall biosynthesis
MHVAIVMYAVDADGAVYDIARRHALYLAEQGDRVTLISDRCPSELKGVNCENVNILKSLVFLRLDFELVRFTRNISSTKWRTLLASKNLIPQLLFPFKAAQCVEQILLHEKIDCLLCEQVIVPLGFRRIQKKYGIPVVFVEHGPDVFASPWVFLGIPFTIYYRFATKLIYKTVNHIIAVSEGMARCVESHGAIKDKISVVHNGIDICELGREDLSQTTLDRKGMYELLFVGRLESNKGVQVLLDALTLLQTTSIHCRFIGDGPLRTKLPLLAQSKGIYHMCEFLGHLPRNNLGLYYRAADCAVFPSFTEGFPLVVLEAMVYGLPVVGTNIVGLSESIEHGKTGFLVPPRDPQALARAILRICEDEELRRSMSQEAKKAAERFSWPHLLKSFRDTLVDVVRTHSKFN